MMMMMDEDMEEELVYTVHEIDLDYEFDACKFVDFCQPENFFKAREAEMWFESAPNYPPSPFVAKLMIGDMSFIENVNVSPKGAVEDNPNTVMKHYHPKDRQMSVLEASARGLTFYNHLTKNDVKEKPKARIKSSTLSRNSTLMKPTASQLAKQNKPHQSLSTRFNTPLLQTSHKSMNNSSGTESQAPKRQKLNGGLLHKIVDTKQPSPLVHKAPKKDVNVGDSSSAKLKQTIPKEPEFVTRQKVQILSSRSKTRPELVTPTTVHSFRARPLNRKILEAPSMPLPKKSTPRLPEFQEFHLKTAERSLQHSTPSSSLQNGNTHRADTRRPSHCFSTSKKVENDNESLMRTATSKRDNSGTGTTHMFKALPVNKKIFSSRGDLGVSRSTKRNVTLPMEFKFETEKRMQHNPPVDLFSKLSLAPDIRLTNGNEKFSRQTFATDKDSKENKGVSSQQEPEMTTTGSERTVRFWHDQFHCGSDKVAVDSAPRAGRWLGIH